MHSIADSISRLCYTSTQNYMIFKHTWFGGKKAYQNEAIKLPSSHLFDGKEL